MTRAPGIEGASGVRVTRQGGERKGTIMGRKITFKATIGIEVDEDTWANEYGIDPAYVADDVRLHLNAYVASLLSTCSLAYLMESTAVRVPMVRVEA